MLVLMNQQVTREQLITQGVEFGLAEWVSAEIDGSEEECNKYTVTYTEDGNMEMACLYYDEDSAVILAAEDVAVEQWNDDNGDKQWRFINFPNTSIYEIIEQIVDGNVPVGPIDEGIDMDQLMEYVPIQIEPELPYLMSVGDTYTIAATGLATIIRPMGVDHPVEVEWVSSTDAVQLEILDNVRCKVTAVKPGTTVINVTIKGLRRALMCTVRVLE